MSFGVRMEKYLTQVSFLQLLAVGYPLPDLQSRLVLKSYCSTARKYWCIFRDTAAEESQFVSPV